MIGVCRDRGRSQLGQHLPHDDVGDIVAKADEAQGQEIAGPAGNRYGDPSGVSWVVVVGPAERTLKIETGSSDRVANMRRFSAEALKLFAEAIGA